MLFECIAIFRKPEELAKQEISSLHEEDILTPDLVFRDPYLLDFLGLTGAYNEKDVEAAVLRNIFARQRIFSFVSDFDIGLCAISDLLALS